LTRLAWHTVPVADRTRDQAHGRVELRTLKVVCPGHPGHPQDPQPAQPQVANRDGLCDHQPPLPAGPPRPARRPVRGHWAIEALHHVRDVTFAEDASQVRTGTGPQVMACLRNLVIGVFSRAGPVNLAALLRHHARDPARPLATLGITLR
jgi:hypothetical protein